MSYREYLMRPVILDICYLLFDICYLLFEKITPDIVSGRMSRNHSIDNTEPETSVLVVLPQNH